MCAKMGSFSPDSLLLPHRVWKVKFVGESCVHPGRVVPRVGGLRVARGARPAGCVGETEWLTFPPLKVNLWTTVVAATASP